MRKSLIAARESMDLTQEEVARSIGVSRSFYTQIESATRGCSLKVALRISSFFNKPVDELLEVFDADEAGETVTSAVV